MYFGCSPASASTLLEPLARWNSTRMHCIPVGKDESVWGIFAGALKDWIYSLSKRFSFANIKAKHFQFNLFLLFLQEDAGKTIIRDSMGKFIYYKVLYIQTRCGEQLLFSRMSDDGVERYFDLSFGAAAGEGPSSPQTSQKSLHSSMPCRYNENS